MRISDTEIQKLLEGPVGPETDALAQMGHDAEKAKSMLDREIVAKATAAVIEMPDREEMIAALKSRIDAGTYNPSGEEIVDAMVRRAIADDLG